MQDKATLLANHGVPPPARASASASASGQRPVKHFLLAILILLGITWSWHLRSWNRPLDADVSIAGDRSGSASHAVVAGDRADEAYTDWADIPTSQSLRWVPCFRSEGDGLLCARLTVPMDYARPLTDSSHHPEVHIAMVLLPGAGHGLETSFSESPLLINPGGPGGSGTSIVLSRGRQLQALLGRHRDILGFDPRGMGATLPKADCFFSGDTATAAPEDHHASLINRYTWLLMSHDIGLANSSNVALAKLGSRARGYARLCNGKDQDATGFRYLGTPNVARDMLSIVQAWDRWLDTGVAADPHIPSATGPSDTSMASPSSMSTRGKLVYAGFSYGTLLGATFAAMFPDKVGRLLLDAVVDAMVYEKPAYLESMVDADDAFASFFSYCHAAGPRCSLYRQGDSAQDIRDRYDTIMKRLAEEPVIVVVKDEFPVMVTASDVKAIVFLSVYFPVSAFPFMAWMLDLIHRRGDLIPIISPSFPQLAQFCPASFRLRYYPDDSPRAVSCSDHGYRVDETTSGLEILFQKVANVTTSFADIWTTIMIGCHDWKIEARFPPEWDTSLLLHSPNPIKTSFPVLFIGNTLDPVTPLRDAFKMLRRFANASLVELEAEGHSTLARVSLCIIRTIRDYLENGVLPPPPVIDSEAPDGSLIGTWEKCKGDERPWQPFDPGAMRAAGVGVTAEEVAAMEAWKEVQRNSHEFIGHLLPNLKLRRPGHVADDGDYGEYMY